MIHKKLIEMNKDVAPEAVQAIYAQEVEKLIRKRYSVSAELSILRQRDTKRYEFTQYFEYAEECKAKVKEMLGGII